MIPTVCKVGRHKDDHIFADSTLRGHLNFAWSIPSIRTCRTDCTELDGDVDSSLKCVSLASILRSSNIRLRWAFEAWAASSRSRLIGCSLRSFVSSAHVSQRSC
eukprot:2984771-Pyramimonas_sp.AAC.1